MFSAPPPPPPLWVTIQPPHFQSSSGRVGAVVKISASQSWGPRFDSGPGRGLNIWVTFFPAKVHSAFHPPGVGEMSTAYMDQFEAAARGAYMCFRSAGGKLIIVKRLWACYMEMVLYKCTTFSFSFGAQNNSVRLSYSKPWLWTNCPNKTTSNIVWNLAWNIAF